MFSACTTSGKVRANAATAGTSRNPAMFDPQWQTNTPTRGVFVRYVALGRIDGLARQ